MALETKEEIVLGFYEDGELKAISRKNGEIEMFTTEKMTWGQYTELFKTEKLV